MYGLLYISYSFFEVNLTLCGSTFLHLSLESEQEVAMTCLRLFQLHAPIQMIPQPGLLEAHSNKGQG